MNIAVMALILVWRFITALAHLPPGETAMAEWLRGTHKTNGSVLTTPCSH